jgi:tripartite-type tricarboxylate transporter receptor subunit TctC
VDVVESTGRDAQADPNGEQAAMTGAYPNRAISVVAPFPPGHVSDLQSRLLAPHVADALQQPVAVDNWPGAGGTVALERLRDTPADGYTVMMHGFGGLAVTPHLVDVAYDPRTDFAAVVKLVSAPFVLVTSPSLPVEDVDELVALARKQPSRVKGGSFGVGTNSHLALILFNRTTGLEIPHTAYPGGFETTEDLVECGFDLMFEFPPVVMRHIEAGHLKPLALTGTRRSSALPNIPTLKEIGVGDMEITGWQGIIGPRDLPLEVVTTLNSAFAGAQVIPEVKESMQRDGYNSEAGTPEAFAAFIREEFERWGALIREEGIRPPSA